MGRASDRRICGDEREISSSVFFFYFKKLFVYLHLVGLGFELRALSRSSVSGQFWTKVTC
jgi:hypothetical protein